MSTTDQIDQYNNGHVDVFAKADKSIPFRIVGTYEYRQSLDALDRLVAQSTPEQIVVYNKMLDDRPEFSFCNGVDSLGTGRVALAAKATDNQWLDPYMRRGLPWMTALARVELGATMSMYGDSKKPFAEFAPSAFDLAAYLEIMFDDVVVHLKDLAQDSGFRTVVQPAHAPDSWTLAYLRRIKLIRDMLAVLYLTEQPEMIANLVPLESELKYYQNKLVRRIWADENLSKVQTGYTSTVIGRESKFGASSSLTTGICKEIAESFGGGPIAK